MYAYDEMGNILNRYAYAFTTRTLGSLTGTKTWYNGTSSTFGKLCYGISGQDDLWIDSFGNPYYNQETCEAYTWNGRELTSYDTGHDEYYYYSYNSDGIRTKKVKDVYGELTTTYYIIDGTQILGEICSDGSSLYYYYDENGSPVALSYNNSATYYYYKNIFGDVLGILDSCGNVVVRYYYDAWGNIISTTGSMASTLGRDNPFRYRGYYYDNETGFYYLNARYYNPEWGRFISPDEPRFLGTDGTPLSYNLYLYCGNNPVMGYDPTGNWDWGVFGKIVAATAVVALCLTGVGAIAAAAATVTGISVTAAVTTSVAAAGITVACGTADGIACAIASGGDWVNGAVAGAVGSSVGAVVSQLSGFMLGADNVLRLNIAGRMTSSFVYDITYEYLETGTVDNWGEHAVDVIMDTGLAPISYGYVGNLNNSLFKAGLNGIIDGCIDVFQTSYYN